MDPQILQAFLAAGSNLSTDTSDCHVKALSCFKQRGAVCSQR